MKYSTGIKILLFVVCMINQAYTCLAINSVLQGKKRTPRTKEFDHNLKQ